MSKENKRLKSEMKRKLRKRRKEIARAEKASVRKEKRKLREHRRKFRKSISISSLIEGFFKPLKSKVSSEKNQSDETIRIEKKKKEDRHKALKQRQKEYAQREKALKRKEKKKLREHKRKFRKSITLTRIFKDYLKQRRRKIASKKKRLNESRYLREKIRQDKINHFKLWFTKIFKKPVQSNDPGIPSEFVFRYKLWIERFKIGFGILKNEKSLRKELGISYVNSLVGFILGFIAFYMVSNLASIFAANIFNIPAIFYSYRVFWPLYTYSALYTRQVIIIIFGVGPFLSLFIGIAFFQILVRTIRIRKNFNVMILWMIFHAFNMFFGAYIVGVITRTGFIYTSEWIFLSNIFDIEEIILLIFSAIMLLVFGVYFTRYIILTASNNEITDPRTRLFYIGARLLLPWLSGVIILLLLNYPNNPPEFILLMGVSFVMVLPPLFNYNSLRSRSLRVWNAIPMAKTGWIYIVLLLIVLAFYKFVLFYGVSFS